jgi:uncharacterized protein YidB (DUF937 family)
MGLLEDLAGTIEKHSAINGQQHLSLVQEIWRRFGNSSEIAKLMDAARSKGLGEVVDSWIKPGPNKPVSPDEAKDLVGEGWVKDISARTGIPQPIVAEAVAKILPDAVNKATPGGTVPKAA